MNWIDNVVRPKIRTFFSSRETPENLWIKCPETGEMVFHRDLEKNDWVVPSSGHHMRMPIRERLNRLFDNAQYELIATPDVAPDPLRFRDERRYTDRLKDARAKTGETDAFLVASGTINAQPVVVAAQNFAFMGGSLGMAAGEAFITACETAVGRERPLILFAASGGARMQEGILSLMQLPRTTIAVQKLKDADLPYIVVLTNPTTGGVTASYAMLGDIHIAEPGALIGFAGPRVIEQTIREKLPEGFQRAEYLLENGMLDMVVKRSEMRETLSRLVDLMTNPHAVARATETAPVEATADVETSDALSEAAETVEITESEPVSIAAEPVVEEFGSDRSIGAAGQPIASPS
ncbi:MAG: acetyl-CoA carboxylase, carboxyltransferase subunit beta [Pseudomonadota bacterium]